MNENTDHGDDWLDGARSSKTGRFNKGHSGNTKGRPPKPGAETMPYELAKEILKAGAFPIPVKDGEGKSTTLPAFQVVLRQLAVAAAKGDKTAARLFVTYTNNAAHTIEARKERQFERLGAYLRSLDEGRPWRLDATEAAFYQRLADEAGIVATIKAHDASGEPEPLDAAEMDAITNLSTVWRAAERDGRTLNESDRNEIARRVIRAFQEGRAQRGQKASV
jgi:hypothetical protein